MSSVVTAVFAFPSGLCAMATTTAETVQTNQIAKKTIANQNSKNSR